MIVLNYCCLQNGFVRRYVFVFYIILRARRFHLWRFRRVDVALDDSD